MDDMRPAISRNGVERFAFERAPYVEELLAEYRGRRPDLIEYCFDWEAEVPAIILMVTDRVRIPIPATDEGFVEACKDLSGYVEPVAEMPSYVDPNLVEL